MYKSKKGLIAALTGVFVGVLLGVIFTQKKSALRKIAKKGKDKLEKGKEEVSNYAAKMQDKARDVKKHFKTANG